METFHKNKKVQLNICNYPRIDPYTLLSVWNLIRVIELK